MTRDASTIAALDVLASEFEAEAACITLRQAAAVSQSPSDRIAYRLDERLLAHPEVCAHDDDYPGWADHIAKVEAQNRLQRQVAAWNAAHPVGTAVTAYPGIRPDHPVAIAFQQRATAGRLFKGADRDPCTRIVTTTRSRATVLGGHTAVVWVHGHSACIALTHIDVHPGGAA